MSRSRPSSSSKPISLLTTPPSLFGSSVSTLPALTKSSAPKKKGNQPRKQKPVAGKTKKSPPISPRSVSVGSDVGGDFEVAEEVCSPTFEASSASVIEQSNLRNTFKFSQDDADEPVYEPALTKSSAPKKKKGHQPRKQKPVAGKKKKSQPISQRSESDGGDFEMADFETEAPTFEASSASVIEQSNLRKTFKFSQDDADEPVYEPGGDTEPAIMTITNAYVPDDLSETSSPGSPQNLSDVDFSKVKLEAIHRRAGHIGKIYIRKDSDNEREGYETSEDETSIDGDDSLESVIKRELFQLPCAHGLVDTFKAGVRSNIIRKLRGMLNKEPAHEVVFELADSVDLLRLLGASDPVLDAIGKNMREGVILYENGMEKVNEGQDMLRSALSDISLLK